MLGVVWPAGIAYFILTAIVAQIRVWNDLKTAVEPVGDNANQWEKICTEAFVPTNRVRLLLTQKTGPALIGRFPGQAVLAVPGISVCLAPV